MTPKFLKPARSESPLLGWWLCAAAAMLLGAATGGHAQETAGQVGSLSIDPKQAQAYVRFWNMLPPNPENNLILYASDRDIIAGYAPNNVNATYTPVKPGNYTLIIKRSTDGAPILQRVPASLPAGALITLLATQKNGQEAVELINDTPDPHVSPQTARIVLRQFFPGARITASVAGVPTTKPLEYGEVLVLDQIPAKAATNINLQAVLPTKPPVTKNNVLTADFSVARHATLLFLTDSYGRFRPTLAMDGVVPPAEP